MDNVVVHDFVGSASAQVFSISMHALVVWIGAILVRGYYGVFQTTPSNITFAMVLLLVSMVTTSIILGAHSMVLFFSVCLFCELNSHYAWVQILWTGVYSAGFILLYLILKRKINL
jgi:hypothetical protein